MTSPRETLAHRWFEEVWNKGRIEAIDEMLAPGAVVHGIKDKEGNDLRGPEGFKPFFQSFHGAFPDIHVEVEHTVVEGDSVAAYCVVRGTHTSEGLGFAPTQKPIMFTGICILAVEGGMIVEAWNGFDFLGFYQQLGVLPPMV